MKNFQTKNTDPAEKSVLDVDDASRRVKVVISKMGNLDLDNDVIDRGAYTKTVKERGPKGSNLIWHLTDHTASLKNAVGKFSEITTEGDHLVGVTNIPNTTWGNDVLEFYKTGHINQHSVGFRVIKGEPVNAGKADEYYLIKEILLYEGSAVLWAANPSTPTLAVGKSLSKEDMEKEYLQLLKDLSNFTRLFSKGHFSDETFELIEIREAQLTARLKQLIENLSESATEPQSTEHSAGKKERCWNKIPNILNLTAEHENSIYQPAS